MKKKLSLKLISRERKSYKVLKMNNLWLPCFCYESFDWWFMIKHGTFLTYKMCHMKESLWSNKWWNWMQTKFFVLLNFSSLSSFEVDALDHWGLLLYKISTLKLNEKIYEYLGFLSCDQCRGRSYMINGCPLNKGHNSTVVMNLIFLSRWF